MELLNFRTALEEWTAKEIAESDPIDKKLRMKLIFSIFLFVSVSFHDALACGDSLIVWEKDFKLSWHDFKGNPPDCRVAESALIYVEIKTKGEWKDDLPSYKVYTCFDPQKSWTLDSVCLLLLRHEQLHLRHCRTFFKEN